MKNQEAILAFSALAQETRLNIFRLLVRAGPEGLAAGRIAELLDKNPSALSFHFKEMAIAGLVHVRQEGRFVVYGANYDAVHGLVGFLMEHCCEGAESPARVTGKSSCGTGRKKAK
ncbi:ArsR/SmtB family transcription factor [Burkholderia cenocepacia]|uniref:ArsR/SmtB family transcription factor n=1 Tax=Burkholderia cenocepacia TaxID=95486 RepID=UPI00264D08D3|nr:metalloregulator ArsR/SmtB family transcription factor [Burkholderia cenocepacia]MDN7681627.1 metalloregulator ArsR/SmtB family transcription factor [Burkholderia cenocepacia]